jgi:subtilisin-like proprotein convertase family protein
MRQFLLGCAVVALAMVSAYGQDFSNPSPISIPSTGPAVPYPSPITVSGVGECLDGITVTLTGINHTNAEDLDILLVGPTGASVILMSDAGGGADLAGLSLTYSDAASGTLPNSTRISSGSYRPTNCGAGDTFPAPAPPSPYGDALAGFIGTNPNGLWRLFVIDDSSPNLGEVSGGWSLHLTAHPRDDLGACCSPGGICRELTATYCAELHGYWQGPLSSCDPNPCTPFNYYLAVDEWGEPTAQAGDGYPYEPSGEFYYYPQTLWWNMWWPNEFDLNRQKVVNLDFLLDFPSGFGYAEIAINYGTDAWTVPDRPPLPGDVPTPDLEDLYIGRLPLGVFQEPGHYTTGRDGIVLPYCPSWVSVDIRGYGFVIVGDIVHTCPPVARGACCVGPACSMETPDSCATIGGDYMGDGTDCFPNPCVSPPPEYWLQVQDGVPLEQGGTGFDGQWYLYPSGWWNMWWPNEWDLNRVKIITIDFDVDFPPTGPPLEVAFNFTAPSYQGPFPPLPPDEEYIERTSFDVASPGHYTYSLELTFCPAWVSVDVLGTDFTIQGTIDHVCLPGPLFGACCFASGDCQMLEEADCHAQSGYWRGVGTTCDPNPCTPYNYYIQLDDSGGLVAGGGDGYSYTPEGTWYLYPNYYWWNQWWPNEFDLTRQKQITLDFMLDFPSGWGSAEISLNWATDAWTYQGLDRPPLPSDVPDPATEDMYIMRLPIGTFQEPGHYVTFDPIVLPYCPSWVSIDVRGYGFEIVGDIVHICRPAAQGACCVGPACSIETPASCAAMGGAYMGDGTDCFPNPCVSPPPEYWLQVQDGVPLEQGGTGFDGQWFYYPDTLWYNMWWPNEFDLTRQKLVTLEFDIDFPAGAAPPVVAFNYSTSDWDDPSAPPLPPLDQYIIRRPVDPPPTAPGHYVYTATLPYCPAWVSIDVQASDASIQGSIEHECLPAAGGACCVGWDCSIQPDGQTCVDQLHGRYMGDGTTCDPNPCPITDTVVCEPQGDPNPVHPPTYWYDVTPADFGRCDFHVRVYDPDPANYAVGPMPPTWQFLVHTLPNGETWASWWDPDCSDAIFGTFRFQFTHHGPSDWGDWTTTIGANNDPYDQQIDASWHHTDLPDGYGYRVHVPLPPETGACCFGPDCVPDMTQSQCESELGAWQGAGSDCFPNPCLPTPLDYLLRLVNGEPVEQGGTGFGGVWFFYPDEAWWNMWWPNEFDLMRRKQVTLDFWLDYPPGVPGEPWIAINFSTPDWQDPTAPPLPPSDQFIERLIFEPPIEPGHHVYTMTLPYCPMWVSVDVRGSDLQIQGTIEHECLPRPCLDPADSNCDGSVNGYDIDPFVMALTAPDTWLANYPCDYLCANDINCDEAVNGYDIDPFVQCLTGTVVCTPCP